MGLCGRSQKLLSVTCPDLSSFIGCPQVLVLWEREKKICLLSPPKVQFYKLPSHLPPLNLFCPKQNNVLVTRKVLQPLNYLDVPFLCFFQLCSISFEMQQPVEHITCQIKAGPSVYARTLQCWSTHSSPFPNNLECAAMMLN